MLDCLELGDRLAELLPLARVPDRVIEGTLRETDHLRADADASFVQRLDGHLVALADLAEHVRPRDAALLEQQLARAAGADAELVLLFPDGEPVEFPLDEERRDAAIARLRVRVREDDEDVGFVAVGDPELAPREDEFGAAIDRARRQRERVASGSRLRQGVRADGIRRELRQIAALEFIAAPTEQRVDDERVLDVDEDADRRIDARQRLDREHCMEEARAGAAERLGNLDAHHAEIEQLVDELARNRRVFVHVADDRSDLAVREFVHAVAEEPFVFGQRGQGRMDQFRVLRRHG